MSRTLDVQMDASHGTVEGYRQGCRGSHCPAGDEHGLSCATANRLAAGDWQYMKALRRGLSPAQIAAELNLRPVLEQTPPKKTPKRDPEAAKPKKEQTMSTTTAKPSQSEIRAWAREVGLSVPTRGSISRNVVEAFNARGKGVQASDVKPEPTPEPAPTTKAEPVAEIVVETPAPAKDAASDPLPDWTLPLAADDLRMIADAIDALEKVPRSVVDLVPAPVLRPGDEEVVGTIVSASGFEDDPWLGFIPRGGAA